MAFDTNSHSDAASDPDLRAILSDVAVLKRDVASLIGNLKSDVAGDIAYARNAAGQLGDGAQHLYEKLTAQGERSVKAVGRQVEEQPILSLLIAFAVGFIGSRMLSRRGW